MGRSNLAAEDSFVGVRGVWADCRLDVRGVVGRVAQGFQSVKETFDADREDQVVGVERHRSVVAIVAESNLCEYICIHIDRLEEVKRRFAADRFLIRSRHDIRIARRHLELESSRYTVLIIGDLTGECLKSLCVHSRLHD